MPPTLHRRRKYLINKPFQLRYAAYIFTTLLIVTLASTACISFGVWNMAMNEFSKESLKNRLETASRLNEYERARIQDATFESDRLADYKDVELLSVRDKEILLQMLKDNNMDLAGKALLLFFFIGIGTVVLTHKIAGPHFRFLKTFQEIRQGNVKLRVHLRKDDQVQDLVPHINSMIGSLDYSFSKLKVLNNLVFEELDKLSVSSQNLMHYKYELETELNRYSTSNAYKIT